MRNRHRTRILAFVLGSLLSILSTALTLANDGQIPFPR
jgi:hypothetical protein